MVAQLRIEMDRRTIRAPLPGRILQLKLRPGEFADSAPPRAPLLLLGDDHRLHVRAEIDENLAWRFDAGAAASVFVRGNPDLHAPLQFERVEPYVVPKSAFTGSSTERADTRVLQVIYSFDRNALPVYVGQQVDVFIQAAPVPVDAAARRDAESP
jgi:multidrug resistance efflux pump